MSDISRPPMYSSIRGKSAHGKLDSNIRRVWLSWLTELPFGTILRGTRDQRSGFPPHNNTNKLYYEDDTTFFYLSNGSAWIWAGGEYARTQSQIAAFIATLGLNDAGLVLRITDFQHRLRWSGTALAFVEGDRSGYLIDSPIALVGSWLQLCDGSATTYLKPDGTTGAYTTRNLVGYYRKSVTSLPDALNAAVAPGLSGSTAAAATGITVATHPDHIHDDASALGTPDLFGADLTGSGTAARTGAQKDTGGSALALTHAVTDPTHLHPKGTLAADALGEPAHMTVLTYFVR